MSINDLFENSGNGNDILNSILVFIVVLIILSRSGRPEVCGYSFGCFNPANLSPVNLLPTNISPEAVRRTSRRRRRSHKRSSRSCSFNPCCRPCCRPCCH